MHTTVYNTQRWRDLPRDKQRFLAFIEEGADGCWLWRKPNKLGYGQFWADGTNHVAHRWAYKNFIGPISRDLVIVHLCGNSACVNPEHLDAVTRKVAHSRERCGKNHLMDEANTYVSPSGIRYCRECRNIVARQRRAAGKGRPEGWSATRRRILDRDLGTCTVGLLLGLADECSDVLDVHHRIPRAHGGSDDDDNLYVVCRSHHMRIEGLVKRLLNGDGWEGRRNRTRRCPHRHPTRAGREACERKLNRL